MTCPVCGTATVPGARFCFHCGQALTGVPVPDAGNERRIVTVLFGDLSEFTSWAEDLDPERVGVVTDRVLASLAHIVGDFGGHVDKLTGDGIMAVFGAPTAHEDDPERAVRAAAGMQAAVRRLVAQESGGGRRLGLRVGLNTGEVVAGVQAHLSYTVIGDTVNTAARLSDAAGVGAVLAGRDTALATSAAAAWRALPPLRLKGKREPVPAYELGGLRPASAERLGLGDDAPFLGREAEFGVLVGRLLDVTDAAVPRTVLITGEAGLGKTRLAQEVSRFAGELPGARVLWGRCAPYGEGRDLAAVADMVRTACGILEDDDLETARERVARTVSRLDLPDTSGLVPAVLSERLRALLGLEPAEPVPGGGAPAGPPVGGDRVRQAVAALFSALGRDAPLLLVLDDVQWATRATLEGLVDLAPQVRSQVMMLVLGRPDVLEALPQVDGDAWWRALPRPETLALLPLEDAASERLLRAYLGDPGGAVDEQVRSAVLARAQGNPFFLAELLHLLVDRGVLRREHGGWTLHGELGAAGDWSALPAGVQAVLAARIDGLDGPVKGVLRDASVVGTQLTPAALEAVGRASGHGDPAVVQRAVDELVGRRLLEPVEETGSLRFAHTLVRDVAYAGLPKAERARRHAAAAEHLLVAGPPAGERDLAAAVQGERAVHLAAEMRLARSDPAWRVRGAAVSAFGRIGQAALTRDDHPGAERALARALALADRRYGPALPEDVVLPVRVAHAEALAHLQRLAEAESELGPALEAPADAVRAGALAVLGEVRRRRGDGTGAREAFVSALAAASSAGVDRLAGEALRQLGRLDYFDGRLRAAEQRFREAHVLARQVSDARGAGWALQHLAWSATTRGDYALADRVLAQAADVFAELGDSGGLSWVAGTEGFLRLLQGRFAQARELAGSVLPLGEAMGEWWGVGSLLVIDALAAAELGEIAVAAEEAERARARFAEVGDAWGHALALTACGIAARGGDEPDRAVALFGEAVRLAERRYPVVAGLALVAAGYAHLDRGDLDGAEACAWRAAALLAGLDLEPRAAVGAKVLLAQVLRRRGDLEGALEELDDVLATASAPALLFPVRQALAHRAGTLLELDRPQEALVAARTAVATPAEDVRSRVLALRALGSALRACGDELAASAALAEALEVARSTGMRAEVAATERALAAS